MDITNLCYLYGKGLFMIYSVDNKDKLQQLKIALIEDYYFSGNENEIEVYQSLLEYIRCKEESFIHEKSEANYLNESYTYQKSLDPKVLSWDNY